MNTPGLSLKRYTDASAPDYDGLRVIQSSLLATGLSALFISLIWFMEDVGAIETAVPQITDPGISFFATLIFGFPVAVAVARYIGVRGIATDSLPYALSGVLLSQLFLGSVIAVVLESAFGGLLSNDFIQWGGAFITLVFVGNLIVNGTDIDMSSADSSAFLFLVLIIPALMVQGWVWDISGNGIFWTLYLFIGDFIKFGLLGGAFLMYYMHDVQGISSADHSLALNSCTAYLSATSVPLIPIDAALYTFLVLKDEEKEESNDTEES